MKTAWLTDIHLNFLDKEERVAFYQTIVDSQSDSVLLSGDIAEAPSVSHILIEMQEHVKQPVYFVLGNHDYYRGQVESVRFSMQNLRKTQPSLFWLPYAGLQKLDANTILLGIDGWADGRLGNYQNSPVVLNDSHLIADLLQARLLGKFQLLDKMQALADADAEQLENDLSQAIQQKPKKVIILTHIPPFKEACYYRGQISDDNWLPFYSSKATGDVLMKASEKNPAVQFLVLCGHTHGKAVFQASENLIVKVGKAEYYEPKIQELISL